MLYLKYFISLFLLFNLLGAQEIDISKSKELSILKNSHVYISKKDLKLKDLNSSKFAKYSSDVINVELSKKHIWVKFTLKNGSNKALSKSLVITSPIVEEVSLYEGNKKPKLHGVNFKHSNYETLYPIYHFKFKPNEKKEFILHLHSELTPLDFKLLVANSSSYLLKDKKHQFIDTLLIGFVLALAVYSFLVFLYVRDISYFYYSLYLLLLIFQQFSYLGLTQIYLPWWLVQIDIKIPVLKIGALIIASALFAVSFLKAKSIQWLYSVYKFFMLLVLVEMLVFNLKPFYSFKAMIYTGFAYIIFNLFAGFVSYYKGNKEARLFIVGFGIVFVSYIAIIFDSLGFSSTMQKYQNILIYGTAIEALILSLAFADRYIILQKAKEASDKKLLKELEDRKNVIESKVLEQTLELNQALKTKELLIKEIHHRVKNNLQIILSMIRMHSRDIDDEIVYKKLSDLENRINAIAKTYSMLLTTDNLEYIDMQKYIESLVDDITQIYDNTEHEIDTIIEVEAKMPLKQAVYVGLIVNELVTNAYEYAFNSSSGIVKIILHQKGNYYLLVVEDTGDGVIASEENYGVGLKLINTLIRYQLEGEYTIVGKSFIVEFKA